MVKALFDTEHLDDNKRRLSLLMEQMRGKRLWKDYALDCGIVAPTLSKYYAGRYTTRISVQNIQKMFNARDPKSEVSLEELLAAAGYPNKDRREIVRKRLDVLPNVPFTHAYKTNVENTLKLFTMDKCKCFSYSYPEIKQRNAIDPDCTLKIVTFPEDNYDDVDEGSEVDFAQKWLFSIDGLTPFAHPESNEKDAEMARLFFRNRVEHHAFSFVSCYPSTAESFANWLLTQKTINRTWIPYASIILVNKTATQVLDEVILWHNESVLKKEIFDLHLLQI